MSSPRAKRILVADDSPVMATLVAGIATVVGAEVVGPADTGTAASDLYSVHLPEAAVLDINMPGLSGLEVLKAIRLHESGQGCFVVVMTGDGEPAVREAAIAAGADHFLHKLTELDRLEEILGDWMSDAPMG